jgi:hypothetical protein
VDRAINTALTRVRQDKARVLQERILDRLEASHGFVRADLARWVQDVHACGAGLTSVRRGAKRSADTGVYPLTTHTLFMAKLKEAMNKVKDLAGPKPTPSQRHEAIARFHVQYITANTFPPPSASAGPRERLLTSLYHPLILKNTRKPQ